MEFQDIILEEKDGIAVLTFNRPDKLNALTLVGREEITQVFEQIRDDEKIRVLVITGAGGAFCAGADVGRLKKDVIITSEERSQKHFLRPIGFHGRALANIGKPTIAAVNGVAAGVGVSLALICDIRMASENARFAFSFVKRGLSPDTGSSYFLSRLIGLGRAFELMYTGDTIDAREADRIGLVNRVVPADTLIDETMALARKIAKGPPITLQLIKRAVLRGLDNPMDEQFFFETYANQVAHETEDYKEGVASFKEKREPVFKGR
jgi:2-(1,2-epoxy-1,2-dihydrophenyl)acetyl-CoA isomerase